MSNKSYGEQPVQTKARSRAPQGGYFQENEREKKRERETDYLICLYHSERSYSSIKKSVDGTSLVSQWLTIRLPMQGTRVRALVREDPTCCGATKPVCHNY